MSVNKFYTEYKGIWYKHVPKDKGMSVPSYPFWRLSDTSDGSMNVMNFHSDKYTLIECFELFKKELNARTSKKI